MCVIQVNPFLYKYFWHGILSCHMYKHYHVQLVYQTSLSFNNWIWNIPSINFSDAIPLLNSKSFAKGELLKTSSGDVFPGKPEKASLILIMWSTTICREKIINKFHFGKCPDLLLNGVLSDMFCKRVECGMFFLLILVFCIVCSV